MEHINGKFKIDVHYKLDQCIMIPEKHMSFFVSSYKNICKIGYDRVVHRFVILNANLVNECIYNDDYVHEYEITDSFFVMKLTRCKPLIPSVIFVLYNSP